MYIPEWEIEDSLIWNPDLIRIPGRVENLRLVERQRYLKNLGRYIDLLFKNQEKYIIVEIKCVDIDQPNVVTHQVLEYKKGLSKELKIPEDDILCILTTPKEFSKEVKQLCKEYGVITIKLDENQIINSFPKPEKLPAKFMKSSKKITFLKLMKARGKIIDSNLDELDFSGDVNSEAINSVSEWIREGVHDECSRREIAQIFKEISHSSPICAHEVGTNSDGQLSTMEDMWFWLFYSVLDRRANAATFINARKTLEERDLFMPQQIVNLIEKEGETQALEKITNTLDEASDFALIYDVHYGRYAFPKSIIDAAKFIGGYNFDFQELYMTHVKNAEEDLQKAYESLKKEIKENIYGAGPRITSQFIRGMVLKGPWDLPLKDDQLLEKCSFNVRFAGKARLSLIENEEAYYKELGKFADDYLYGNRAIISHVLWYIRKRYCDKKILCDECKLAGYCRYYYKTVLEPTDRKNTTLDAFGL